ncbi:MAG: sterol desaturase family protein [Leptospiraceae bacterium]|nr:sterol desaturase family protein [Leptospiraceae bacterium]
MKIIFFSLLFIMLISEILFKRREYPIKNNWILRSVGFTTIQFLIVILFHNSLDRFLEKNRLYNLDSYPEFISTSIAFLVMTFVSYWQHRLKHKIPFLWRYLHQIHHSPERLEVLTSFYRNPLEIIINMVIMSSVLLLGVGANVEVATNVVLLLGLADMFYHWNVKTPYWIGFIIQRPESHGIHHLYKVHSYNFGDIVIWDMLFGTFKNLKTFNGKCGFGENREEHILAMMMGKDMSEGRYKKM